MSEPPKLFERIHETFRLKHLSLKRVPLSLSVNKRVAASTQNIALDALLFLYKKVLCLDLPYIDNIERAKQPDRLPVVFTQDEVRRILAQLDELPHLIASPLYGSGIRLGECMRLRIKAVLSVVIIRSKMGSKKQFVPRSARPVFSSMAVAIRFTTSPNAHPMNSH